MTLGKLLFVFLLSTFFTSCYTTYYYAQVESADPYTEKAYNGNFTINSDSLRISYSFQGENAPIKINIFNKMSRRLIVDWESSWFVFGDNLDNKIDLGRYMSNYDKISILKPYASKKEDLFELSELNFHKLNKKLFSPQSVTLANGSKKSLKVANFNDETTPLYIRSMLNIHIDSISDSPLIYEQDFYINKIINGEKLEPTKISFASQQQGDVFYTRKEHGRGLVKMLEVSGQVLLITGIVAVDIMLSDKDAE